MNRVTVQLDLVWAMAGKWEMGAWLVREREREEWVNAFHHCCVC